MAIRDISPVQWQAPGTAQFSPGVVLTSQNQTPLDLDTFLNIYSPTDIQNVTLAATTEKALDLPDTTNQRFVIVIPPRGNAVAIQAYWTTGTHSTAKFMNPNGIYIDTFDPSHMPPTLYLYAASAISGVQVLWF